MGVSEKAGHANGHANGKTPVKFTTKSYQLPANKSVHGPATKYSMFRALFVYLLGGAVGTYLWLTSDNPQYRVFGAGLILPGSGYLALGRWYILAGVLNLALFPVSLLVWYLIGIVPLPLGMHYGAAFVAAWAAKDRAVDDVLSYGPHMAWAINTIAIIQGFRQSFQTKAQMEATRQNRNEWMDQQIRVDELLAQQKEATMTKLGDHELTLDQLRHMQRLINLTRQPLDSWEGWTAIDQFRESAYRYQVYYMVYILSATQCNVLPNFHGYLSEAQRTAIRKCCQQAAQYYWALEATWGRFSFNWDPIDVDNIMVTGWFLFAIMAYTSTTRDTMFAEDGSLLFQVTPLHRYPHSIHTMVQALVNNWNRSQFCLYSCEPNWVYTACNAYGAVGTFMYDRVFGSNQWKRIQPNFVRGWKENFILPDGSIMGFLSSLLGLTLSTDSPTALAYTILICRDWLPDYAKQLTAIFRKEKVQRDENGKVTGFQFGTMDLIDPGSYRREPGDLFGKAWAAMLAKEIGDDDAHALLLAEMERDAQTKTDRDGSMYATVGSNSAAISYAGAKLLDFGFWDRMIKEGPPEHTFEGPLLAEVPYPEVLVAKAWSNGKDLDMVLYDGQGKVSATIELTRLKPGKTYQLSDQTFKADISGKTSLEVVVEGRTPLYLKLVD